MGGFGVGFLGSKGWSWGFGAAGLGSGKIILSPLSFFTVLSSLIDLNFLCRFLLCSRV